jgi:hypothetical protein
MSLLHSSARTVNRWPDPKPRTSHQGHAKVRLSEAIICEQFQEFRARRKTAPMKLGVEALSQKHVERQGRGHA